MRTGGELDGLTEVAGRMQEAASGFDRAGRMLVDALSALAAGAGDVAVARAAADRAAHVAPSALRLVAVWAGTLADEARTQHSLFGEADQ